MAVSGSGAGAGAATGFSVAGPVGAVVGGIIGLFAGPKKKKSKIYIPVFSKWGRELKGDLYKGILERDYPANLAEPFIRGSLKRAEGLRRRQFDRATADTGFRGTERAVSGTGARGFLAESGRRFEGAQAPEREFGKVARTSGLRKMSNLQAMIDVEASRPVRLAQAGFLKSAYSQARGAEQGAMLGMLPQLAAISYAYNKRNKEQA